MARNSRSPESEVDGEHGASTEAVVIDCNCELGEGLFVSEGLVAWVDIGGDTLFAYEDGKLRSFSLPAKVSVILARQNESLIMASADGIGRFDLRSEDFCVSENLASEFKAETHRTNDGCRLLGGDYLVGTMHKSLPSDHYGSIYRLSSAGELTELDDEIRIPNSFIELDDDSVLISDSESGVVYRYEFPESAGSCTKSAWYEAEKGVAPDGGCRLPNGNIAIAMWDAECVRVFNHNGSQVGELGLPVKRPTNCKFDAINQLLWITSAREGLGAADLERCPDSGKTFGIPMTEMTAC